MAGTCDQTVDPLNVLRTREDFNASIWSFSRGSEECLDVNSNVINIPECNVQSLKDAANYLFEKSDFSADELKNLDLNLTIIRKHPHPQLAAMKKTAPLLCDLDCALGIEQTLTLMDSCAALDQIQIQKELKTSVIDPSPIYHGMLSLSAQIETFIGDPVHMKAMYALGHKIWDKVPAVRDQGADAGDLFTDAKQVFLDVGMKGTDAQKAALELLGIYGTRGADTSTWVANGIPALYSFGEGMAQIGMGLRMLDILTQQKGAKIYSMPSNVHTHMSYLRAYHFWMAAYLSSQLIEKGHSPQEALKSIHEISSLYEAFGNVPTNAQIGTKATDVDFRVDAGSQYQFETQKDIVFDDAGATWAGLINSSQNLEVDQVLLMMVNSVKTEGLLGQFAGWLLQPITQATKVNLSDYPAWVDMIQPDKSEQAFEQYL